MIKRIFNKIKRLFLWYLINKLFVGTGYYKIKRRCMIALGYQIGENTKIVGPVICTGKLSIGKNCWIGRDFTINGNGEVIIKDNIDIAPNVTFITGGLKIGDSNRRAGLGESYKITVNNGCWIGARSTLLGDITLENGVVVGACSCVVKDVSSNKLVGGVPAKTIKELDIQKKEIKMDNRIISVIIPMYNSEQYIERCLTSVINQTFKDFEIIVINDGSKDSSEKIVKKMAKIDDRIKLLSKNNEGVSVARNVGINEAKGLYMMFLDSDDELPKDSLESLYNCITDKNADIVVGKDISIGKGINIKDRKFSENIEIWENEDAIKACLEDVPNTWNVCGKLFKSNLVKNIEFIKNKRIGEDSFYFFTCCINKPKVVYYDKCVYYVHLSENSATRSPISEDKINDILYFLKRKQEIIKNKYPHYTKLMINYKIKTYLVILNIISNNYTKQYKKYENEAIKYIKINKKYFIKGNGNERLFNIVCYRLFNVYKILKKYKNN